jgi:glycosyltransferase involved in cell wall biosynthesis
MKRVLFFGAVNENQAPHGGEEYKNQLILHELNREFEKIEYVDTIFWKKSPIVVIDLFWKLLFFRHDSIVISASSFSTYRLLKILFFLKPNMVKKINYIVTGGYFPEAIINGFFKVKFYIGLNSIVVQGENLKKKLSNHFPDSLIKVIPNFKDFPSITFPLKTHNDIFRFVFVGRISKEKGVSEILDAVEILKRTNAEFEVDFYGPVEQNFNFTITNYCGFLDFQNNGEQAYTKLASYDCMLFPTYWKGEGFPGVIIDAFIAGLPVIATDWNMNTEIIEDGINGFIIPPNDTVSLANKMMWVMENRFVLNIIRAQNQKKAKEYHVDRIWPQLVEIIKST